MTVDVVTLSWCLGEIREALAQTERQLERQMESEEDDHSAMRAARAALHQAHGALEVVGIEGVSLVTREAENLLDAVAREDVRLSGDIVSRFARAFRALVEHLEGLMRGQPHQPLYLYPYYQRLLEARKADRIHPADLFFPDLTARVPDVTAGLREAGPGELPAARTAFERGLLLLMRDPASRQGPEQLRTAIATIAGTRVAAANRGFWWVARAYFDALAQGSMAVDVDVKRLLARLNLQLRKTLEEHAPVAERIVKDMLFALARVNTAASPLVAAVRQAYALQGTVPEDYQQPRYGRLDERALRTAREALTKAKGAFDRLGRGSSADLPAFSEAINAFCDAIDHFPAEGLRVLGRRFADVRRAVNEANGAPRDAESLEIAMAILFAEQALEQGAVPGSDYDRHGHEMAERLGAVLSGRVDAGGEMPDWLRGLSQAAQDRMTMAVFVAETGNSLRGVEKVLDAYFRDPTQRDNLPESVRALHQISGVLRLLGHDDAAAGAEAAANRVATFADAQADSDAPDQQAFEQVASSVGAIGFFVEELAHPDRAGGRFEFDPDTGEFHAHITRAAALEVAAPTHEAAPTTTPGPQIEAPAAETAIESLEVSLEGHLARAAAAYAGLVTQPNDASADTTLRQALGKVRDAAVLLDRAEQRQAAAEAIAALGDGSQPPDPVRLATALASAGVAVPAAPMADLPSDEESVDSELLEIFMTEAEEVLAAIAEHAALLQANPSDQEHLTTIRRSFHTLKGSSRMVGLMDFGEAAWALEQVLNLWLAEERRGTPDFYALIAAAHAQISEWVRTLRSHGPRGLHADPQPLVAAGAALRDGQPFVPVASAPKPEAIETEAIEAEAIEAEAIEAEAIEAEAIEAEAAEPEAFEQLLEFDLQDAAPAPAILEQAPAPTPDAETETETETEFSEPIPAFEPLLDFDVSDLALPQARPEPGPDEDSGAAPAPIAEPDEFDDTIRIGDRAVSRALYMIFLSEADDLVRTLGDDLENWIGQPSRGATREAAGAANALAGSAAIVQLDGVHDLAKRLEEFMQAQRACGIEPGIHELEVAITAVERMQAMLHQFAAGNEPRGEPDVLEAISALAAAWLDRLAALLPESGAELPIQAETMAVAIEDDVEAPAASQVEETALPMAQDAEAFDFDIGAPDEEIVLEASAPDEEIVLEAPASEESFDFDFPQDNAEVEVESLAQAETEPHPGLLARTAVPVEPLLEAFAAAPIADAHDEELAHPLPPDELDAELLPVFIEEAEDHLPQIGENLRRWLAVPGDHALPQTLMRQLHTVKGSARMAGAMAIGQLVHDIETRIEPVAGMGDVPVSLIDGLVSEHDRVVSLFEALKQPSAAAPQAPAPATPAPASAPVAAPVGHPFVPGQPAPTAPVEAGQVTPTTSPAERAAGAGAAPDGEAAVGLPFQERRAAARTQPLVRVRADVLDRLVNEAGEVSIARSRLDNELTGLRQSLADLTENVARLRSQLREIEIQADTQIQTRIAQRKQHEEDFDPLEFDRYTRFQELARMLAESVNDVATVQQNALRGIEDASQDLQRQGRVLRDLQQNLMRVRMVQFGSIADRLYRVVRQSAKELGKRVHLDIRGASAEVDRGILERMAAPIEHLLRNSVSHGIEEPAARTARGKTEVGEIAIEVRQDGREIVLGFSDDGGGFDYERIRAKAISSGLITAEATLNERELGDLIFMPGFTTATTISEISGRGVGMDVVRAEVASLGGRIETQSVTGQGTRFTIHLPMTLAVAQVVLVTAGRARFAVPSASVEQVLQLKPQALASAYAERSVDWQGERIPLFYLGTLVELQDLNPVAQHYSPVVVLRSGHQRIALHCDEVARNQEVVVKSVGAQAARVRGISGATVLGNGEIVLIVNPVAFAQYAAGEVFDRVVRAPRISADMNDALPAVVMVVDDSLTVRKVTQRLLAREGYKVLLAKDGVDALRQLEEIVPDVMLVDIEMPRMDGFDLTRNLRGDERFRDIPIVMITSRTADKHRSYAMSLGVNEFLGKPYDEDELLAHVAVFTAQRRRVTTAT